MKKFFSSLFILVVLFMATNSFAQTGTVVWALSAGQMAVSGLGAVTASNAAPTAFFTSIAYNTTFAPQPYGCKYGSASGWPASQSGQVATQYVQYQCTATSAITVNSVTFDLATCGGTKIVTLAYYSKDNWASNVNMPGTQALATKDTWYAQSFTIGAPSIAAGGTFTVRLYPYNGLTSLATAKYMGVRAMTFNISIATGIRDLNQMPTQFGLDQNYPNPFNPTTTISYGVPQQSMVTLKVYDILGNEVATLVNGVQPAGNHVVSFDASKLTSGVYIYRMQAGSFTQTKKMILMK
jgi:hypothetical protein